MQAAPWRADKDGLWLDVRLTPRAGHDRLDGIKILSDGRAVLLARVRAVPEKGAANAALITLLAKVLSVGKSGISVHSGQTARVKRLRLAGDPEFLVKRLAAILTDCG
ncbi:DUF167 domain-containing protein [Breoghania sp. L-A4]|nr:DUF167 family protein [Breoghania sp. L-A4]AXS42329.1 DUF167 domain-containing protein [Breoghania sp. L-A4]